MSNRIDIDVKNGLGWIGFFLFFIMLGTCHMADETERIADGLDSLRVELREQP